MNLEGFKHGDDIIVTLSSVMGSMPVQGKLIRGPYKGRGEAWFIHHNDSMFIGVCGNVVVPQKASLALFIITTPQSHHEAIG